MAALALAVIAGRAALSRSPTMRLWRPPLFAAAAAIAILAAIDPLLAAKSYPVAMSLVAAVLFGTSLLHPPSLIERFARLREPNLPPGAQEYCQRVTMVWTGWLMLNAAISALLAAVGDDAAWAIWTGLVSYLVMGLLYVGEIGVRRVVRRRAALG